MWRVFIVVIVILTLFCYWFYSGWSHFADSVVSYVETQFDGSFSSKERMPGKEPITDEWVDDISSEMPHRFILYYNKGKLRIIDIQTKTVAVLTDDRRLIKLSVNPESFGLFELFEFEKEKN